MLLKNEISKLILFVFAFVIIVVQKAYSVDSTRSTTNGSQVQLEKTKLDTGWENKIDYENETLQRLFWMAASGEPKWSEIRKKADSTLVSRGENAIPFLITKLTSDDARQRLTVNNLLKKIGKPAIPYLTQAIDTSSLSEVWSLAIKTLGDIGDTSTINYLVHITYDTNRTKRTSAVSALASYNQHFEVFIPRLRELISDTVPIIRRYAFRCLIKAQDLESIPKIIEGINDSVYSVRETILQSILTVSPTHDSANQRLREKQLVFQKNICKELEKLLKPKWNFDSIPYYSSPYVVNFQRFRKSNKDIPSQNDKILFNLLNLYRLLNGKSQQIWKRAEKHSSETIRLLALQHSMQLNNKVTKKQLSAIENSCLLKGQLLSNQFRKPTQ